MYGVDFARQRQSGVSTITIPTRQSQETHLEHLILFLSYNTLAWKRVAGLVHTKSRSPFQWE